MSLSVTLDYESMHAYFKSIEVKNINISGNNYITFNFDYSRRPLRERISEYLAIRFDYYIYNQITPKEISEIEANYLLLYKV